MKIIELEEVGSTSEYCKQNDCGEDLCVFAKRQTAGKGTKGRSFISLDGGLYVADVLFPYCFVKTIRKQNIPHKEDCIMYGLTISQTAYKIGGH